MGTNLKNRPHLVVGITGRSGAGKTTIARAVVEHFKLPRQSRPASAWKFAGPLKDMLRVVGVTKGEEFGETKHPLFRTAAQRVGMLFRELDEDFWVDTFVHAVRGQSAPSIIVVDDLRFPNEQAVCDLVVGLRSVRDGGLTAEQMLHASERQELAVDVSFDNDTPQDAGRIADEVAELIKEMLR